ncbi:fumarylacetoacetate hydrolase family protein [Neobacillus sp. D3-1R]|uniref:fumarylacetoacetate hydrolase family protein n=1 Tax=Neobacillus sp. D3-1R TaxID=3445778 RepID=UPI003F9ED534
MKLVTAVGEESPFVGMITNDEQHIIPLKRVEESVFGSSIIPDSLLECIKLGSDFIDRIQNQSSVFHSRTDLHIPINQVRMLAPIHKPEKNIICVGKNYVEHAIEMGSAEDIPEHMMVFTKAPTTVVGPSHDVLSHSDITNELDYEGELAIIIGKKGKGISREEALDYVFGYSIINDITARDLQSKHKQFFIGKSLDTSCPMGPWIVHKSVVDNPNHLNIQTKVNGELRQDSNTKHFIFDIEEIISVLSKGMTLEPGDIIATGTPAGVGKGYKPPKFLKHGDVVTIEVETIGILENKIY